MTRLYRPMALAALFCLLCLPTLARAVSLRTLPNLESIVFWEFSDSLSQYRFAIDSSALTTQLSAPLSAANSDFQGQAGREFYDVYYSNAEGIFDIDGGFITVAASSVSTHADSGGLNLAEVRLEFADCQVEPGGYIPSFLALGDNARPPDAAPIDGDLATHTALGNSAATSDHLHLTVGFRSALSLPTQSAVSQIYNRAHPQALATPLTEVFNHRLPASAAQPVATIFNRHAQSLPGTNLGAVIALQNATQQNDDSSGDISAGGDNSDSNNACGSDIGEPPTVGNGAIRVWFEPRTVESLSANGEAVIEVWAETQEAKQFDIDIAATPVGTFDLPNATFEPKVAFVNAIALGAQAIEGAPEQVRISVALLGSASASGVVQLGELKVPVVSTDDPVVGEIQLTRASIGPSSTDRVTGVPQVDHLVSVRAKSTGAANEEPDELPTTPEISARVWFEPRSIETLSPTGEIVIDVWAEAQNVKQLSMDFTAKPIDAFDLLHATFAPQGDFANAIVLPLTTVDGTAGRQVQIGSAILSAVPGPSGTFQLGQLRIPTTTPNHPLTGQVELTRALIGPNAAEAVELLPQVDHIVEVDTNIDPPPQTAPQLLVRGVVGSTVHSSAMEVVVNRRLRFQVETFTLADSSDATAATDFQLEVPLALGEFIGDDQIRITTVAGVEGIATARWQGLTAQLAIKTVPSSIDHLLIEPAAVTLAPGESVDFNARGVDRFGNEFPLVGVNVGWIVAPPSLGEIGNRTGILRAANNGEGYVIAVVDRSLNFGITSAEANGTGKITVEAAQPEHFALHANHPNPFNAATQIGFDLAVDSFVELSIYNLAGQHLQTLLTERRPAGHHVVSWQADKQPSGTYLYRLRTNESTATRKMLLLK